MGCWGWPNHNKTSRFQDGSSWLVCALVCLTWTRIYSHSDCKSTIHAIAYQTVSLSKWQQYIIFIQYLLYCNSSSQFGWRHPWLPGEESNLWEDFWWQRSWILPQMRFSYGSALLVWTVLRNTVREFLTGSNGAKNCRYMYEVKYEGVRIKVR